MKHDGEHTETKMATRDKVIGAEELSGEDLDMILDILDCDILDTELVDVYEEVCEQVIK